MDGKEDVIKDGEVNIQNCFLKPIQKFSESVYSEECARSILRGKKTLRYLFCIAEEDANLPFQETDVLLSLFLLHFF